MAIKLTFAGSGDAFGSGGRLQTCFIVDAPGIRFAIDFGASSLIALNRLGIPHNSIDLLLLTHLHGDHCGGVPFMVMDAMLGAKRQTPLTIAGPRETTARMPEIGEALFPGMGTMSPKFDLDFIDLELLAENRVGDLKITPYPAIHSELTNPTSLRIEVAGKVIAYTGDSAWTEHMLDLARGADLFISECYFFQKPVPFHMNYPELKERIDNLGAKRVILTHLGPEMLQNLETIEEECAYDGLEIEI